MKRIAAALSAAGAVISFIAVASTSPASAAPSVTCSTAYSFEEAIIHSRGGHFWNHTTKPYTLYSVADFNRNITKYCLEPQTGSGEWRRIEQKGTSRCLRLQGRNRTVVEGSCTGSAAEWHFIGVGVFFNSSAVLIQSQYNKACIWQTKIGFPVTYKPCSKTSVADKWLDGTSS